MNFTTMAHPLFFLLSLSIFLTTSGTAASFSSPYCQTYYCGNGLQIRYPFWLRDNTTSAQFCGYPDFGLTCSDSGEPILSLPSDSYYVKNIDYEKYTLTLVDIDIVDQPCPRARHNLTINDTVPLSFSSSDLNLTFYFNCTSTASYLQHIQCLLFNGMRSYVFVVGEETEDFDWVGNCEEKVVATVMESEINIGNLSGGFGGAMKKGFVLDWRNIRDCVECEAHDGLCGYNNTTGESLCFCKDGFISRENYCKDLSIIPNDILCQALGKPDNPGHVRGQDRLVRPSSYFHQPSDDMKKIREEWEMMRKEMHDAATRQVMSPPTPHSDMGSNNIRQQLPQPVVVEKPMFKVMEEPQPPELPLKQKVVKCKLVVERKGNVVATGTLIEEKGSNRLVVINVAHKPDARLPLPNPYEIINVGDAIGFELDWPTNLVILENKCPRVLDKGKKKMVKTPSIRQSKPQSHSAIKNFQKFVDSCLSNEKTYPVKLPTSLFSVEFRTYISREDCEYIISSSEVSSNCISFYLWHMHDQLHNAKKQSQFVFVNPFTISRAGLSTPQIEKRAQLLSKRLVECHNAEYVLMPYNPDFHWVLVVIEPRKMIVNYLDPMRCKPCDDLKDIVNIALRISAKKTSKREPSWQIVQCPRQEGGFECGYFVMRFIKEIIVDPTIMTSKFDDKKTYSQVEFDEIRGEWATFVLQLIMNHVDVS